MLIFLIIISVVIISLIHAYFHMWETVGKRSINELNDNSIIDLCDKTLKFLQEDFNVKPPKFKIVDLSEKVDPYKPQTRLVGVFIEDYKLIGFDMEFAKEKDYKIIDVINVIAHEFCHYIDCISGNGFKDYPDELLELRAEEFERKYGKVYLKKIVKSLL